MKTLPLGIQTFKKLIQQGYLYVDKTQHICRLLNRGSYFFLSRPRRFGKSLTLSTIKEIFEGNKELFKGLWIENQWNWNISHPVIHLSFSKIGYKTQGLESALYDALDSIALVHGIKLLKKGYDVQFAELVEKLSSKGEVVILVDEYDKPIIDYLGKDMAKAEEHREILKTFFSAIKDSDPYLRFFLVTGVSKFSRVSIFSELNNLTDITMHPEYNELIGYTQEELEHYFSSRINQLCTEEDWEKKDLLVQIKTWYNGYSWGTKKLIYNPYSVLSFFSFKRFNNFWFTSGTPTFLVNLIKEQDFFDMDGFEADSSVFESYDLENLDLRALLFQTGYITIKGIDNEFGIYTMGFPNREVQDSMMRHLIGAFREYSPSDSTPIVIKLRKAFYNNDIDAIIELINSLFAHIPYQIFEAKKEKFYHAVVHLVFFYLGQFIDSEVSTSRGRIDAVVKTKTHIYVLEFKLDSSAQAAIKQIKNKGYADHFKNDKRKIVLFGINFSSKTKMVGDYLVE